MAVLTLRLGLPRDLRVVLYGAYVRVQYASCCSSFPPVRRILQGGTWFAVPKAERVSLLCIDAMCGDWVMSFFFSFPVEFASKHLRRFLDGVASFQNFNTKVISKATSRLSMGAFLGKILPPSTRHALILILAIRRECLRRISRGFGSWRSSVLDV